MTRLLLCLLALAAAGRAFAYDWVLASADEHARAGAAFRIELISLAGEPLPGRIALRVRGDRYGRVIDAIAAGEAANARRAYSGTLPAVAEGALALELADRASSVLVLLVQRERDAVQQLTAPLAAGAKARANAGPPLSAHDPMYFIAGTRGGASARFQISFKYRLFDEAAGLGREQPWLTGLYFGYTQNSLWDLSSESKPFRDTSYRPSLFWDWRRLDDNSWIDGLRAGLEHESNGKDGLRSRSVDTAFVRPSWRWQTAPGETLEFAPKFYAYLDKDDNPDIHRYRGYADWHLRYARGSDWALGLTARAGTAGKGSFLADYSVRTRALAFGPLSGYLHLQWFSGYGEDILGYNQRRKSQFRVGVAIVP
ncbi:MAG: phospholipase A [Burkholderiales bacterium]